MRHGIDGYFDGLRRDRRRVAGIGIAVAIVFLAGELVARQPGVRSVLNDPMRFGFEGPEQFARRILLERVGQVDQPGSDVANVVPVELHAGGGRAKRKAVEEGTTPGGMPRALGTGPDEQTLVSRMRALALEGPVVRSEELVVEKLVRPEYPEDARLNNVEGVVEMVALVDTTGDVTEVHIIGGSHEPLLERSASSAALQSRYRPYRLNESSPQRVWAYYRVRFSLY